VPTEIPIRRDVPELKKERREVRKALASSIFAVFSAESIETLPYRIFNSTAADLRYRQHLSSTSSSFPLHRLTLQAGLSVL
jgi:hypothetical protein